MRERRPTVTMTVPSTLCREDLPRLLEHTCALLACVPRCELLLCEVGGVAADAVALDALARLALSARRSRCEVRLCGASAELLALVELAGLDGVLRCSESPPPGG
jgi:ABC-type transporter Mla MlaB component